MSEWISVSERRPEGIGHYLIYSGDASIPFIGWAFYNSEKKWVGSTEFYKGVTHWRELPDPPKDV